MLSEDRVFYARTSIFSGGGPIHACVPVHAHPQFSERFTIFHRKYVYHIILPCDLHAYCTRTLLLTRTRKSHPFFFYFLPFFTFFSPFLSCLFCILGINSHK